MKNLKVQILNQHSRKHSITPTSTEKECQIQFDLLSLAVVGVAAWMSNGAVDICQAGCGCSGGIGGPASAAGECQSQVRDAELFMMTMLYSRVSHSECIQKCDQTCAIYNNNNNYSKIHIRMHSSRKKRIHMYEINSN